MATVFARSTLMLAILFFFIILMISCAREEENVLEYSDDQLVSILADLHMIESAISIVPTTRRDTLQQQALERCAALYNMSADELFTLVKSIERDIPKHRKLYPRVIDTLEYWENHADSLSIPGQQEINKDSIVQ